MTNSEDPRTSRRVFLAAAAAGGAYVLAPRLVRAEPTTDVSGGPLLRLTERPTNYESVRSTFTTRITPTERFYVRSHFDTPTIDPQTWRLAIGGRVQRPLSLSLTELSQMPQVTVEAVLQCAGNGRALFSPRVAGVQWQRGAIGNAQWRGVRLVDVLERAGFAPDAAVVQLQGADRPVLPSTPSFIRGLPIAKAIHRDTLVALQMNGAPLPLLHGGPARLVVPGWVADGWTKWISTVTVQSEEPKGFFYETAYRYPIEPVDPGSKVPPEKMKPMSRLNVKSIIGSHDDGDVVAPGRQAIVGVAFAGETGIRSVDVSVDGGISWSAATLDPSPSPHGFVRFHYDWNAVAGSARIASRATDGAGAVQPATAQWNPSGYLYNAIDPVHVEVRA